MATAVAACAGYVALVVTLTWMLQSWHPRRFRKRLPSRPGPVIIPNGPMIR